MTDPRIEAIYEAAKQSLTLQECEDALAAADAVDPVRLAARDVVHCCCAAAERTAIGELRKALAAGDV
jgi:hypothetical protein